MKVSSDGAGHRYLKTNNTLSGDTSIYNQTYSVRDAQGNILAIYNSESVYRKQKKQWVWELVEDIIVGSGLPTYVNNFLVPLYGQDGHFKQFLFKDALKRPAWTGGQLTAQPVSWFVVKNKAVKSNMLSQSGMYPQMFKEMARYSDSGAHPMLAAGLDSLLRTSGEWNLFAQNVFGFNHEAFDVSIRELAGAKLCLDPDFGKGFLEHFGYPVDEPEWADNMPTLLAEMEEQGRGEEFTERFQNLAVENREGVLHFLDGFVSDTTLMGYGPYVNSLEDGLLLSWFNPALGQYTSSLRLGAFLDTWNGARKLMNSSNDTASLLTVVYDDDENAYLNSWAATAGNDRLAYALAALPDLQLPVVLDQAQALLNYNPSIFILNVLKYQRIHLAAHVLYGSSRLGTKDYTLPGSILCCAIIQVKLTIPLSLCLPKIFTKFEQ